jgi:hypothetical protein
VKAFFENFKELWSRHNFTATKTYNLDVTGNSTLYVPPKITCAKGIKQVRSVTSGKRDLKTQ